MSHSAFTFALLVAAALSSAGCFSLPRDPNELAVGEKTAPVEVLTTEGVSVALSPKADGKTLRVLVFYRGAF